MTVTLQGWEQDLMMSLRAKEASYDAAVTPIDATKYILITGHSDLGMDWPDEVKTNKDTVSGEEHGTTRERINQQVKFSVAQPDAKPLFVIGMMAAAYGSVSATQDPGKTAYKQAIAPVTSGTALPSFNTIGRKGGKQYLCNGCMVDTVNLSAEAGKSTACSADIIGSGTRSIDASSFVAETVESWMLMKNGYSWIEGSTISIGSPSSQGAQFISSGTPRDLKAIIKKYDYKWKNALAGQYGFGAGNNGVYQGMHYGQRSSELTLDLLDTGTTDLDYYLNDTVLAAQLEVKGALIAAGGTFYYGYRLRIPRLQLMKPPLPQGGIKDALTCTLVADIQNDGTNSAGLFEGYSAIAAFFA